MNRFYKLVVSYDGTHYQGWQSQKNKQAVSNVLADTFKNIFHKDTKIIGASRTDAGVHALAQVARLQTDLAVDPATILRVWNSRLPQDIFIHSLQKTSSHFHPLYHVEQKTYWYHFFLNLPLPFVARYGWHFNYSVDIKKLESALQVFVGTHDFRSFCSGREQENTVRTIDSITLSYLEQFDAYRIEVKGKGFLHHMIRRIIGACLEIASRDTFKVSLLQDVLAEKNPNQTLPKAPAQGLFLKQIMYEH